MSEAVTAGANTSALDSHGEAFETEVVRLMPLTALQRTVLERYRTFRVSPPTLWRMMALASRNHAILSIIFSLGSIYLYLDESESFAGFVAGLGVGAILRDIGSFRKGIQIWPILTRVFDWQKIDDLLAGKDVDDSTNEEHVSGADRA